MSSDRRVRVWRVSKESKAGMEVTENAAIIAGDRNNFVAAHQSGVTLMGKSINFGCSSENQRHGGFFVRMNDFVQMVPTTLVTPMPAQIPWPPFGLASSIIKDLPLFLAMLGTGAVATPVLRNI